MEEYGVPERLRPALEKIRADRASLAGVKVALPETEICKVEVLSEACKRRDGRFLHIDLARALAGEERGDYKIIAIVGVHGLEPVE